MSAPLFLRNGEIVSHPGWFYGGEAEEARLLTAEELVEAGYGVQIVDNPPAYDPATQVRVLNPIDQWISTETTVEKTYTVSDIPFEELRAGKIADLANRRWLAETGGIVVGGIPIFTDDRSKLMITGARIKADLDPGFTTKWATAAGVFSIDAATIILISDAVLAHVDACFDHYATIAAQIAAAQDVATLDAIDITAGWPGA